MAITNDELLEDLKQFINTKVDGVESRLDDKIDGVESRLDDKIDRVESNLGSRLDRVESRLDDIETTQNEILNTLGQDVLENQESIKDHEVRITKLEAKAA